MTQKLVGNYSLEGLSQRAQVAREAHNDYLEGLLNAYQQRVAFRESRKVLPVAFCGHGRSGKDTAAEFLCAYTGRIYPGSNSQMVLPFMSHIIGIPEAQAFAERHQNREFWVAACHAIREPDYGMISKMCLGSGDVTVGTRGRLELESIVREKVVAVTIWIENPRVPFDITVEYGPEDCDLMIGNYGSRLELYAKLRKLVEYSKLGSFS